MHYPIEELRTMPASARQRLARIGIHNTDDLLHQGARPHLRQQLSIETTIPTRDLARWVGMADLVRIKGIGPTFAEILIESGKVGNVQQLLSVLGVDDPYRDAVPATCNQSMAGQIKALAFRATDEAMRLLRVRRGLRSRIGLVETTRMESASQPRERFAQRADIETAARELAKDLRAFTATHRISRRSPTARELAEAAEEAVELRPRVVLAEPPADDAFREFVRGQARPEGRASLSYILLLLGIVVAAVSLVLLGLWAWTTVKTRLLFSGSDLEVLIGELWSTANRSLYVSMGVLAVMVLLVLAAMLLMYHAVSHVQETWLVCRLFNTPPRQSFYQEVQRLGLERQRRGVRWGLIVFGVLALGLVVYAVVATTSTSNQSVSAFVGRLVLPIAAAGVLMVGVIALPVVRFYWQELKQSPTVTEDSFRTYLIYLLSKMVWLPILILLLSQLVLPHIFESHRSVYLHFILPKLEADLTAMRSAVLALPLETEAELERRVHLLDAFDEVVTDRLLAFGAISPRDTETFDVVIPLARYAVFWLVFAAAAFMFAVPYFVLWDWKRAMFYLALVLMAFWVEEELQRSAPTWFSLRPDSGLAKVVVLTVVFMLALFFDWLYERFAGRVRTCSGCMKAVDEDAMFCPSCGLANK